MREASANIFLMAVDDDDSALEMLKYVLDENGVTKYSLSQTKEQFYKLKNSDINLILIDHRLYGDDAGLEIIKEVRQWNEENYIIIMSGVKDFDIAIQYTNLGANKFLYKYWPDFKDRLVSALREGFRAAKKRFDLAIEHKEFYEIMKERSRQTDELFKKLR